MKPGTYAYCNGCRHQAASMAAAGHPAPCNRQYWSGPRLVKPAASADGCDRFEALEPPACVADETRSPEPAAEVDRQGGTGESQE